MTDVADRIVYRPQRVFSYQAGQLEQRGPDQPHAERGG